jgi:hypothetical protein
VSNQWHVKELISFVNLIIVNILLGACGRSTPRRTEGGSWGRAKCRTGVGACRSGVAESGIVSHFFCRIAYPFRSLEQHPRNLESMSPYSVFLQSIFSNSRDTIFGRSSIQHCETQPSTFERGYDRQPTLVPVIDAPKCQIRSMSCNPP